MVKSCERDKIVITLRKFYVHKVKYTQSTVPQQQKKSNLSGSQTTKRG